MLSRILIFGHDSTLLKTRELILNRERFAVVTATELAGAARILTEQPVDLLILCHTLTEQERKSIVTLAHASHPALKVIALVASNIGDFADGQDATLSTFDGPRTLLAAVRGLTEHPQLNRKPETGAGTRV